MRGEESWMGNGRVTRSISVRLYCATLRPESDREFAKLTGCTRSDPTIPELPCCCHSPVINGDLMSTIDVVENLVLEALGAIATLQGQLAVISKQLAEALAQPQSSAEAIKEANERAAAAEQVAIAAEQRARSLQQELESMKAADTAEEERLTALVGTLQAGLNPIPPLPVGDTTAILGAETVSTVPGGSQSSQPI